MIAGLPVHWVPFKGEHMPIGLLHYEHVYVRTYEGSEPQHPIRADHVHWANVTSYAVARAESDQQRHRDPRGTDPTVQVLMDGGAES